MTGELLESAGHAVKLALENGAHDAECTIGERSEFSASVRMRELETLTQAGSRGAGIRVLIGRCVGSSYTSDLTREGIERMVHSAIELAKVTSADPHAGLPDPGELGQWEGDLELYSPTINDLDTEERIRRATAAEQAALDFDPRVVNSEGASYGAFSGARFFVNSRGFAGSYRSSSCSLSAVPVAKSNGSMERDYWYAIARSPHALETPEHIGRKAAERALRRLGARKVTTRKAPIVFEPRTARSLLGDIFDAVAGDSIYQQASFLAGKLGEQIASPVFTVIDDATIPGLFGSRPFDDEGVRARRTVIIENGVLLSYLLNSYTARKLGMKTTGSASRGVTGNSSVGHGNFFVHPGAIPAEALIASVREGFYVTELIGSGVNTVTGDYSQGAAGLWIENGELTYAVSEVTIAGNLRNMLKNIEAVADDLEFKGSIASPTLLIGEMTISGQ